MTRKNIRGVSALFCFGAGLLTALLWGSRVFYPLAFVLLLCSGATCFLTNPAKHETAVRIIAAVGAAGFLGAAVVTVAGGLDVIRSIRVVFLFACLVSAMVDMNQKGGDAKSIAVLVPVFFSGFELLLFYRGSANNPFVSQYAHVLFGYIFILVGTYCRSALRFNRELKGLYSLFCGFGLFSCAFLIFYSLFSKGGNGLGIDSLFTFVGYASVMLDGVLFKMEKEPGNEGGPGRHLV